MNSDQVKGVLKGIAGPHQANTHCSRGELAQPDTGEGEK